MLPSRILTTNVSTGRSLNRGNNVGLDGCDAWGSRRSQHGRPVKRCRKSPYSKYLCFAIREPRDNHMVARLDVWPVPGYSQRLKDGISALAWIAMSSSPIRSCNDLCNLHTSHKIRLFHGKRCLGVNGCNPPRGSGSISAARRMFKDSIIGPTSERIELAC